MMFTPQEEAGDSGLSTLRSEQSSHMAGDRGQHQPGEKGGIRRGVPWSESSGNAILLNHNKATGKRSQIWFCVRVSARKPRGSTATQGRVSTVAGIL